MFDDIDLERFTRVIFFKDDPLEQEKETEIMQIDPPVKPQEAQFTLGTLKMTFGAAYAFETHYQDLGTENEIIAKLVTRHWTGDFGDVTPFDKIHNETAIQRGERIHSAYNVAPDLRVWIMTEASRRETTILLPEEY